MAKQTFISALGFKKFAKVSFLVVSAIFLFSVIFNASVYVPEGEELRYTLLFLGYGIFGVYIFGNSDIKNKWANVPFFKSLPRLFGYIFISLIFFYFILNITDPFPQVALGILTGLPFYLKILYAFVFAIPESSFFQGYLDGKYGILFSSVSAGFLHMFVWSGPFYVNFIGAMLLFMFFSFCHLKLKKSESDLIPVTGIHIGYNFIKLALVFSIIS